MPKRSGKFYRRNEAEVMNDLGFIPTFNSGSGWIEKEDGQNDFLIAQLKSTESDSIKFVLKDFCTLEANGITSHKIPVFAVQFIKTNDVFILARPEDLCEIAKYIKTGSCDVTKIDIADVKDKTSKPKKTIKSGNRDEFWKEREAQFNDGSKNKGHR